MGLRLKIALSQLRASVRLETVAVWTGMFCSCGMVYMYYSMRNKFQKTSYFLDTVNIVKEHKGVQKLMGQPIRTGSLNLGDNSTFYVTEEKSRLKFDISGPKNAGTVYAWCVKKTPSVQATEAVNDVRSPIEPPHSAGDELLPTQGSTPTPAKHWQVMRVELQLRNENHRRMVVYREPEADQQFVDTFEDFLQSHDGNKDGDHQKPCAEDTRNDGSSEMILAQKPLNVV